MYKELDEDHDGKVSNAELKTFLQGIQFQGEGSKKNDFVRIIMDRFDISGDQYIDENEFVKILTKWLQEARKSISQNDYSPLSFFLKPNGVTLNNFLFVFGHILLQGVLNLKEAIFIKYYFCMQIVYIYVSSH